MIERILYFLLAWATLIGGIHIFFNWMEEVTPPNSKRRMANWLKSLPEKSISEAIVETPKWFIEAFDRIFGDKHLTLKCFFRSCIASVIAIFLMTMASYFLYPTRAIQIFFKFQKFNAFFSVFFMSMIYNVIPDYISLLKTRLILNKAISASVKTIIALLVVDLIATGIIFIFFVRILSTIFFYNEIPPLDILFTVLLYDFMTWPNYLNFNSGILLPIASPPIGVFLIAAYFTSIWFYFFTVSTIVVKIVHYFGRVGNKALDILDVNEKPFSSMGFIIMILFTLVFAIYVILAPIFS